MSANKAQPAHFKSLAQFAKKSQVANFERQDYLVLSVFQNRDLLKVNPKTVGGESWRIPYAYSSKAFIPGEYLNGIHTVDFLIWRFPNRTGTYKKTVSERFYHKFDRGHQINGMNHGACHTRMLL